MSEALTSLDEQKLRGWIRQILKEVADDAELLREYTGSYGAQPSTSNFAKAFIDPFANIFLCIDVLILKSEREKEKKEEESVNILAYFILKKLNS